MALGEVVKAYREGRGLSQNDLSKRAGISQGTLSRIENNSQKPTTVSLVRIAQVLEIPLAELLGAIEGNQSAVAPPLDLAKLPSQFIDELYRLENQLTPEQRGIIIKIAQALALQTVNGSNPLKN